VRLFDPGRVAAGASAATFVSQNLNVARAFIGDRMHAPDLHSAEAIEPGQGAVAEVEGTPAALFRDEGGELYAVSPRCTHLQCRVRFNEAELTWDCPCHGSRYTVDGDVLHGPATHPLAPVPLPAPNRSGR
jgi:Rieske Fe-S protein